MVPEKNFGRAESFSEESPQPSAADFGPWTGESFDRTLRMFAARFADGRFDLHPVAHGPDFAQWPASLHHAERAGIHAEEHHALTAAAVFAQVGFLRAPGVIERIIHVLDGRFESQPVEGGAKHPGRLSQVLPHVHRVTNRESMKRRWEDRCRFVPDTPELPSDEAAISPSLLPVCLRARAAGLPPLPRARARAGPRESADGPGLLHRPYGISR